MNDVGARRPDLIGFDVAYARRRNRVTAGFRAILVIPQLIVVYFLGIAAAVVLVIGWFAALILGRLPRWVAEFLAGFVGWYTRIQVYGLLLVDAYPPFDFLAPPGYPVRVIVPPPGKLNRAAVLFRIILAIPAYIVGVGAATGLGVASVLVWLMLVIGGRMPRQLFLAMASIIRFYLRLFAYLALLTPAYPSGLFAEPLMVGDSAGPGPGSLGAGPSVGYGPAWSAVPIPLGPSAKVIVSVLLILGLAVDIADISFQGSGGFGSGFSSIIASSQLTVADDNFVTADNQDQAQLSDCQAHNPTLTCVETAYSAEGDAYSSFASSLRSITYPRKYRGEGRALLQAVQLAGEEFQSVSGASTEAEFNAQVSQRGLTSLTRTVSQDYTRLSTELKPNFP